MAEYFTKDGDNFVEVSDKLHTQSEMDNVIEKRLERERNKFADYETIKEKASKVDSIASEYENKITAISSEKSELEKQLGSAKLETDKVKIVNEFKLSDELAEFVTGATPEEMRTRAEKLAKGVTGGKVTIPKTGKPEDKASDSKAIAGKLFGKKSDD